MAGRQTGALARTLVLAAFMVSLLILLAGVFHRAAAQEASNPIDPDRDTAGIPVSSVSPIKRASASSPQKQSTSARQALSSTGGAPLVVPVYPRGGEKGDMPKGADLRDSYIVLEDGQVMSVADWILGALKRDNHGLSMSDYENRLFLGQVARALVGEDESLVDRTPVPHPVAGLAQKLTPDVMRIGPFTVDGSPVGGNKLLQSGPPRGIYSLNDAIGTSFTDEISIGKVQLLEDPYATAFANAVEDYKLRGTFLNMLHDYEKHESKGQ